MTQKERIVPMVFNSIESKDIDRIEIRTVGNLEWIAKIEVDIYLKNADVQSFWGVAPNDTNIIKEWLEKDNLYEKAKMYEF